MSFKRGIKDAFNGLPLAVKNRMVKALAKRYGYSDTLPDGSPNPQGKLGFVATRIAENIKNDAIEVEWMDDRMAVPRPADIDVGPDENDVKEK